MIESVLEDTRRNLSEIDISRIIVDDPTNAAQIRGRIAERYVYEWLQRSGFLFDTDFPRDAGKYRLVSTNGGVLILDGKEQEHEFDFLGEYHGEFFSVEVKSQRLNGFKSKIDRALRVADEIYQTETQLLLFFPMYGVKVKDAKKIEAEHNRVRCIDISFKKKQLKRAEDRYHRFLLPKSSYF